MTKYEPEIEPRKRWKYIERYRKEDFLNDLAHCEQCLAEALADSHNWQNVVGEITSQLLSKDKEVERLKKLEDICKSFVSQMEIRCAETIFQCDRVITNAYDFIENVCDCIGYHQDEEPNQ